MSLPIPITEPALLNKQPSPPELPTVKIVSFSLRFLNFIIFTANNPF